MVGARGASSSAMESWSLLLQHARAGRPNAKWPLVPRGRRILDIGLRGPAPARRFAATLRPARILVLIIHRRQRHERLRPTSCTSAHPLGLARVRVPAGPTSAGRNRSIVHGCPSTLARRGHAANLRPARRCEARPRRGHCQNGFAIGKLARGSSKTRLGTDAAHPNSKILDRTHACVCYPDTSRSARYRTAPRPDWTGLRSRNRLARISRG